MIKVQQVKALPIPELCAACRARPSWCLVDLVDPQSIAAEVEAAAGGIRELHIMQAHAHLCRECAGEAGRAIVASFVRMVRPLPDRIEGYLVTRTPPSRCPACGDLATAATSTTDPDARPSAGDLTICINCGSLNAYGMALELVATKVPDDLTPEQRDQILRMQAEIRARGPARRTRT